LANGEAWLPAVFRLERACPAVGGGELAPVTGRFIASKAIIALVALQNPIEPKAKPVPRGADKKLLFINVLEM
jgi:hypothetical protein